MVTVDSAVRIGAGWRVRSAVALGLVAALSGGGSPALAHTAGAAVPLASEYEPVSGGPGSQTDPHVSGSLVTWTDTAGTRSRIGYADLAAGTSGFVPNAGHRDSLSDVAGNLIVFRRAYTDRRRRTGRSLFFDVAATGLGVRELAPEPGARRAFPAIGGTTVAFLQFGGGRPSRAEVCVADAADPDAPAVCLTNDGG